jgi:hypothetical protein
MRKTFHETIQVTKDFILNCFEKKPYYNELMPTIMRNNRGNQLYRKTGRKMHDGKLEFLHNSKKALDTSHKLDQSITEEKNKSIKYYKIPKLELMKKRKQQLDNYMKKKNRISNKLRLLTKSNSMPYMKNVNKKSQIKSESMGKSTIKINKINTKENKNNNLNSTISMDTFHTNNNNKNDSMMNFNNKKVRKLHSVNSLKNFKSRNIVKRSTLENILNKCNEELDLAQNMGNNVENYNKDKSGDEIFLRIKNELKNRDQRVIEDNGKGNKKYKKLEKERFIELKKKMDMKVSEDYAYLNRKVLQEFMINNENIIAYRIYMKEMHKINEKIEKKKEIEKKNLSAVENLLENTFRQKEYLKYKIDNYYMKNAKINEFNNFCLKNKDDYYMSKNNYKDVLKGDLLPKLIELKDYCYGRPKYNPLNNSKDNSNS